MGDENSINSFVNALEGIEYVNVAPDDGFSIGNLSVIGDIIPIPLEQNLTHLPTYLQRLKQPLRDVKVYNIKDVHLQATPKPKNVNRFPVLKQLEYKIPDNSELGKMSEQSGFGNQGLSMFYYTGDDIELMGRIDLTKYDRPTKYTGDWLEQWVNNNFHDLLITQFQYDKKTKTRVPLKNRNVDFCRFIKFDEQCKRPKRDQDKKINLKTDFIHDCCQGIEVKKVTGHYAIPPREIKTSIKQLQSLYSNFLFPSGYLIGSIDNVIFGEEKKPMPVLTLWWIPVEEVRDFIPIPSQYKGYAMIRRLIPDGVKKYSVNTKIDFFRKQILDDEPERQYNVGHLYTPIIRRNYNPTKSLKKRKRIELSNEFRARAASPTNLFS